MTITHVFYIKISCTIFIENFLKRMFSFMQNVAKKTNSSKKDLKIKMHVYLKISVRQNNIKYEK